MISKSLRRKSPYSELFWSVFFPHFPAFGLNTERYEISLRIQSECGKTREKCGLELLRIRALFTQENSHELSHKVSQIHVCFHE